MVATAMLSMIVSNTATTLIMMPVVVAILAATGSPEGERNPLAIALTLGVAYAATIGGLGTLVGSPTNAIAAGLGDKLTGFCIDFLNWGLVGSPSVVCDITHDGTILHRHDTEKAWEGEE